MRVHLRTQITYEKEPHEHLEVNSSRCVWKTFRWQQVSQLPDFNHVYVMLWTKWACKSMKIQGTPLCGSRGLGQVFVGQYRQRAQCTTRPSLHHLSSSSVSLALSTPGDCSHFHICFTAPGPNSSSYLLQLFNLRERQFPPVKWPVMLAHFQMERKG